MKKVTRKTKALSYPRTAEDTFVNQKMLYHAKEEILEKMDSRFHSLNETFLKIDARFSDIDARFNTIDARFNAIDARFNEVDAQFKRVDARFESIESKIDALTAICHRTSLLVEEQNNRNKIVLDGLSHLFERQERVEQKLIESKP